MPDRLDGLAAGCLLPSFRGLTVPDWVRGWLDRGLGGVVLFAGNVEDGEQLARLTADLRGLIAVDEEGGDVTRLEAASGSSYPGNLALGVVDDVELTRQVATAMAADLARAGVTVNLAPVADVNTTPDNPVIGVRSFGSDPELVARHVAAFVDGTQRAGVAACAKHFPGHGDTHTDSHLELPVVEGDIEKALLPFSAAIEAGVRCVMSGHLVVPALDDAPATLSRRILTELLREQLGFDGLVITDALDMAAVAQTVGVEESAVRALAAGADALCLGPMIDAGDVEAVHAAVVAAVRSGRLGEDRLAEAAARVNAAAVPAEPAASDRSVGAAAAARAVVPSGDVAAGEAPLVLELVPEPNIAAGHAAFTLGDAVRARLPGTDVSRLRPGEQPELVPTDRRIVLVVRDAVRSEWQRRTAAEVLRRRPDTIVVELGLPGWLPESSPASIRTHGAGRVNLEAAAELLVG